MAGGNGKIDAALAPQDDLPPLATRKDHRFQRWALILLRLDIGFLFLWAFLDKTFGLGYSTSVAHDWLNGGSPTKGFLGGVVVGPFPGLFQALGGNALVDWLFMLGLLGVGIALILGIGIRPAVVVGSFMYFLMWLAVWPPATMAAGQPTSSTNPLIDEHTLGIFALLTIGALIPRAQGPLGRWWASLSFVKKNPWLL